MKRTNMLAPNRKLAILSGLLFLMSYVPVANAPVAAQKVDSLIMTIPLYADSIPNSRPGPDEESSAINQDGVRVISKISRPTLTIYRPHAGTANRTAVIICPGGGYWVEAADLEGSDFAKRFTAAGITAIILKYRIPSNQTMIDRSIGPLQDAQQAIKVSRQHAQQWGINPSKIGIMGFSAGGHLAAMAATHFNESFIPNPEKTSLRPDFLILGYPVITCEGPYRNTGSCQQLMGPDTATERQRWFSANVQVTAETPPAFLVHASDDTGVPPQNSLLFYEALLQHHVPAELHIYRTGGHGFGLHIKGSKEDWLGRCLHWLEQLLHN